MNGWVLCRWRSNGWFLKTLPEVKNEAKSYASWWSSSLVCWWPWSWRKEFSLSSIYWVCSIGHTSVSHSSTRHVLGLVSWIMISLFAREQVWKMFCFNSSSFPEIALPFHFLGRLLGFSIWSAKKSSGEERSQQLVLSHGGIASDLGDGVLTTALQHEW